MKKTLSLVLVLALGLAANVAKADFTFGTPTNLGQPVNSSANGEAGATISADGLSVFFHSDRPGGSGDWDLWVATRDTIDDELGTPINLGPTVNSSSADACPSISSDGLSLYFATDLLGGFGNAELWVTTRPTTSDDWGTPVNLGPTVNSSADEIGPCISADGLQLYFSGWRSAYTRPGGYGRADLWVTTRPTKYDPWGEPVNLGPTVNSSAQDSRPSISADGLALFFDSTRPGGYGKGDLYMTTRSTLSDHWGTPVNLGPTVNSSAFEEFPKISADGSTLFFDFVWPGRPGDFDMWQVPINPVVDLNGDEIVDSADICIMVDHWGEDYPLCDIGPMPWGDGIVDVQDLIFLAEHLFEEILPTELVAYWKLDETEGIIAHDSVCDNDAFLMGDPAWQPDGGIVDGVLQFDGIDDYVSTPVILDPAEGDFSVFAWINGGAPGQVVISQKINAGGVNWLSADPLDGKLMTELKGTGRFSFSLMSESVVTDGNWHRVGFVRDGSDRILYVDDIEVARDTTTNLESASGGLYIGAGSDLEPGAFWSGLIDDVRIYNRAVKP